MLMDIGKLGSMREIEFSDIRSVLHFLKEYHLYKNEDGNPKQYFYGDHTDFA